ncbi:zf-HC2 domain-containing protein [Paenibacillus lycopersici]|uniref:Zf-HC2 domain-containing protein n=1 Tax=Paenibacillus lycopersici TaxID=2704462 RepID=A0A6C0FXQ1_9BACL|nr:zf-HC2 domain-containing protein [Paenibacillus lycopersici]QHT60261.1 zf-HC2 domain-containing protein [Paenibacillus lycopersici]
MNCQEVMDYMQRQLDGDLDERETEILMNHTRHCSDCAAMFERLKLLSAGLENLPKVVPSYSLVDAILPKLAELQPSAPEPSSPLPNIVIGGVEPAAPRRPKKTAGGWRRWLPMTAGGGVVAAGVLLGMFYLSNQGAHTVRDSGNSTASMTADASSNAANDSASTSIMSNSGSTESTGTAPASSDDKAYSDVTTKSAANGSAKSDQLAKGLASVDPNGEPMPPITGSEQDQADVAPEAFSPNQSLVVNQGNDAAAKNGGAQGDSGKASDSADDGAASNSANPPASDANSSGGANAGSAAGKPADSGGGNQPNGLSAANDNRKDFASASANAVMASPISPNKAYQAFIVDDAVSIYTVSDSLPVFLGEKRSGISDLKWSEDSKQLTYTAVQADGSKVTYVVDPQAGTEHTQSSK